MSKAVIMVEENMPRPERGHDLDVSGGDAETDTAQWI